MLGGTQAHNSICLSPKREVDASSEEGLEHNFWPSVPEIMKGQAFVSRGPCGPSGFSSVRCGIYLTAVFLKLYSSKQQSFHMLSEKGGTKITGPGENQGPSSSV